MKNRLIILFSGMFIVAFIICVYFYTKPNYSNVGITKIEYSYSGGFGTIVDTSRKTITITEDGKVVLINSYNSYTENFEIKQDKYNELSDYIKTRMSLFDEKANEEKDALDGASYSIKITLDNGETKEMGGYMIKNKKFKEISGKIFEVIDNDKIDQYEENIDKD